MISARSATFRYVDRKKDSEIVLIPGWATDHRIFDSLDLEFNYVIPEDFHPFGFADSLASYLKEKSIDKVSLFGYSLGGFIACEFAIKYPTMLDELILVGIRKKYAGEDLAVVKESLIRNKKAYLYKFYKQCLNIKEGLRNFKQGLFQSYIEDLDPGYLMDTLKYLESFNIKFKDLIGPYKITIIHGREDRIAPFEEALDIKNTLPGARLVVIDGEGHMPFLKEGFRLDG